MLSAEPSYLQRPILKGRVNFPLCLAPMVGLSHYPLRRVLRRYMPVNARTLWPTEMLNSRRIPDEILGETPETLKDPHEDGLVPQILGNEESFIAQSVSKLADWGAEAIDINMGCPVQKALRHNYGVALMGDPQYAAEVVRITVKHSKIPISVKLRAGQQGDFEFLKHFVQGIQDAGASWICLHPRTPEQRRRGHADWTQIQKLRQAIRLPVIGNGDVQTSEDVFKMLAQTECDMVMAGRALAAKPWMLWQVGERLGFDFSPGLAGLAPPRTEEEEGAEYGRCLLALIKECEKSFSQNLALRKISFYVRTTSVWLQFGHNLFSLVTRAKNMDELKLAVQKFFSVPQVMHAKTQLRE